MVILPWNEEFFTFCVNNDLIQKFYLGEQRSAEICAVWQEVRGREGVLGLVAVP